MPLQYDSYQACDTSEYTYDGTPIARGGGGWEVLMRRSGKLGVREEFGWLSTPDEPAGPFG